MNRYFRLIIEPANPWWELGDIVKVTKQCSIRLRDNKKLGGYANDDYFISNESYIEIPQELAEILYD